MKNRSLRRQRAINYLLKHPDATARVVAKVSGLSVGTVYKIIRNRQTPKEVLLANGVLPPAGVTMLKETLDVFEQRGKTYGDAAPHWDEVAALWTILTGHPISAEQATSMMIGLKLLRLKATPRHYDSIVDIAGYAAVKANVRAANGG